MECGGIFGGAEVAIVHAPVADGFSDAGNELADAGFALGRADMAVQILAGHDVGGGDGPVFRGLDVFLFEDGVALGIGDLGEAEFPLDFVVGGDAGLGEVAAELETGGLLLIGGARAGSGGGGGCRWRGRRGG